MLTWVHYRGRLIVALLAAGNLFCTGCPFVLVRDAGRRFWRHRTLAALASHEMDRHRAASSRSSLPTSCSICGRLPRATAWLVWPTSPPRWRSISVFSGATSASTSARSVSSTSWRRRCRRSSCGCGAETCRTCRTVDCIKGRRDEAVPSRVVRRGCELGLFLPSKVGNLDCTFCLDCVHACPHDNIALATRLPGLELVDPRRRSGVGWLSRRCDIAVLAVLFVFGGLINAFGMAAPARAMEQGLAHVLGAHRRVRCWRHCSRSCSSRIRSCSGGAAALDSMAHRWTAFSPLPGRDRLLVLRSFRLASVCGWHTTGFIC